MEAIPGEKRGLKERLRPGDVRPEAMPGERRPGATSGERRPEAAPKKRQPEAVPGKRQPGATSGEKQLPHEKWPETILNSARLAARLREETTELLALLPAARKAAAGGPAGGEAALDGMARAAYRVLRIAENMEACAALASGTVKAVPICVTALAAAYVNGAAGVCRTAVFQPEWPREPLWSPGCARLFAAALGNLLANAVQYGGERPAVSVRAQRNGAMLLLTVADNGAGYAAHPAARAIVHPLAHPGIDPAAPAALRAGHTEAENGLDPAALSETTNGLRAAASPEAADGLGLAVVRQYAAAFGGQLLVNSAPDQGARFTLCLPLCAPGTAETPPIRSAANLPGERETPFAPSIPPDYIADRFSPLYVQLAPVCDLPL